MNNSLNYAGEDPFSLTQAIVLFVPVALFVHFALTANTELHFISSVSNILKSLISVRANVSSLTSHSQSTGKDPKEKTDGSGQTTRQTGSRGNQAGITAHTRVPMVPR